MSYTPQYLGHVNLFVRNAARAQQWYEDILGLHTHDFVPGRAAFLSANQTESHEIALIEVGDEAPGVQHRPVGLNHLAWKMQSLDDLRDIYQRLLEKKVPLDRVTDHGVSLGIYMRDPDGNGVEVYYELPRSEWFRHDKLFSHSERPRGLFPGPWDAHLSAGTTG
jgi:catechol 2,3-dioxygenase